jgi:hypothetical protein
MLRLKHFLFSTIILTGFLAASTGMTDNLIVYSAKGIQLKSGEIVESSSVLTLQSGQELSLISPTGKIIRLVGPYKGAPLNKGEGRDKKSVKEAIQNLLSYSGPGVESFGITRSTDDVLKLAGKPAPLPSPWVVNVTLDGPYCYQEGKKIIFWRPNEEKSAKISIDIEENNWHANAVWSSGKSKLSLPDSMPVIDGAVYQITLDNKKATGVMNIVPKGLQSKMAQAAWLKQKGCVPQFLTMVRSFL